MPSTSSAAGPAVAGDDDVAWKTMIAAFGALSLSTAATSKKRRLPFLPRIVRTSFLKLSVHKGVKGAIPHGVKIIDG